MQKPKTATEKAFFIARKYNEKYNFNKFGGKIKYEVLEVKHRDDTVKNAEELKQICEYIKQVQSNLSGEDRFVLFVGCKCNSHVKSITITKDYALLNRKDSISPYIEEYLTEVKGLKSAIVSPDMQDLQTYSSIQVSTGCATVASKIAKYVSNMSNEEIKKCILKNPKKIDIENNKITIVTEGFRYYFKPPISLMQNIIKYAEMPRFDKHLTTFWGVGLQNLHDSIVDTKVFGNKSQNAELTLGNYIFKHSEVNEYGTRWRRKLRECEQKNIEGANDLHKNA